MSTNVQTRKKMLPGKKESSPHACSCGQQQEKTTNKQPPRLIPEGEHSWKLPICLLIIEIGFLENCYLFGSYRGEPEKSVSLWWTYKQSSWKNGICTMDRRTEIPSCKITICSVDTWRLQKRCFWNKRTDILENSLGGCFWNENVEWSMDFSLIQNSGLSGPSLLWCPRHS